MGYGSYTASDWTKLKNSRGLSSSSNANQTFVRSDVSEKLNAKFIDKRESFDSEDSPASTPIIIGFDVTGSMGYLANEIATNSLNETIMQILTKKPVTDPHMMCAAITNPNDVVQVTQFEADIRVVEQLLDFRLGGGNMYGFDNLLWYFAAKHTKIDSFEKRGKKGIIIGIGDEIVGAENNILTRDNIKKCFDDDVLGDISFKQALEMASEQYEVVHIVVGPEFRISGKGAAGYNRESYSGWAEALPGRVARVQEDNIDCLAEVIVAILMMLNGADKNTALEGLDKRTRDIVEFGIADFKPINPGTYVAPERSDDAVAEKVADKETEKEAGEATGKETEKVAEKENGEAAGKVAEKEPEINLTQQFIEKRAQEKATLSANTSAETVSEAGNAKKKKKGFLGGLFGNRK